ncbi:MAG: response regulator [Deltaproteobacteria bacterium]|nr:response regulator [Deltaproteobacteria bacterium]
MSTSILIVDDEPQVLKFCKKQLGRGGELEIHAATNALEALRQIEEIMPRLVLLDAQLDVDGMDGIACLTEMRSKGFEGTVCILTDDSSLELLFNAAMAGADAFLDKSNTFGNFAWEMERLLEIPAIKRVASLGPFDPCLGGAFLRSKGLDEFQIELLTKYTNMGFPFEKDLAYVYGISISALSKRFARIKNKLGIDNMSQMVRLMTILSMYGARH